MKKAEWTRQVGISKAIPFAGTMVESVILTGKVAGYRYVDRRSEILLDTNEGQEWVMCATMHTVERGETISVIQMGPHGGRARPMAVVYHEIRTWAFDADPAAFLVNNGIVVANPSKADWIVAAAAAGAFAALTTTISFGFVVGAILAPTCIIYGRKWFLRTYLRKQARILLSLIDLLACESFKGRGCRSVRVGL